MKNMNASKNPSKHAPSGEKLSKGLGGNIGCRDKNLFMVSKGFPNVTTSGQQYNIREKPSLILYSYINHHAVTPRPQIKEHSMSRCTILFDVRVPDYISLVLEKGEIKLILN